MYGVALPVTAQTSKVTLYTASGSEKTSGGELAGRLEPSCARLASCPYPGSRVSEKLQLQDKGGCGLRALSSGPTAPQNIRAKVDSGAEFREMTGLHRPESVPVGLGGPCSTPKEACRRVVRVSCSGWGERAKGGGFEVVLGMDLVARHSRLGAFERRLQVPAVATGAALLCALLRALSARDSAKREQKKSRKTQTSRKPRYRARLARECGWRSLKGCNRCLGGALRLLVRADRSARGGTAERAKTRRFREGHSRLTFRTASS